MLETTTQQLPNTNPPSIILSGKLVNVPELSKRMGVDQSYLRKVLNGKRQPTLYYLCRLAKELDFTIDALLDAIQARKLAA